MRVFEILRGMTIVLASVGVLLPQAVLATTPAPSHVANRTINQTVHDVALHGDGVMRGQVVDPQGIPSKQVPVAIGQNGKIVGSTVTDADGRFQLAGLRGGVYQVATPDSIGVYRLWSPQTAPPVAQPAALIVEKNTVVRGGLGRNGLIGLLSNPWVLGGLTGAAIAIPLLLDEDDDQDAGS